MEQLVISTNDILTLEATLYYTKSGKCYVFHEKELLEWEVSSL